MPGAKPKAAPEPAKDGGEDTDDASTDDSGKPVTPKAGDPPKEGEEPKGPDGKPVKPPKPVDALKDPPDPRWSDRTRTRFEKLSGMVGERDTKITELSGQLQKADQLIESIESTGMGPEQFSAMLNYASMLHSDDPKQLEKAYEFVKAELHGLAVKLGKADDVDLVSQHQDLVDKIEAGTLSREDANEIALARANKAHSEEANRTSAGQREYEGAVKAAKTALNALETELKKDPHYAAKYKFVEGKARRMFAKIHPSHWAGEFKDLWEDLKGLPETVWTNAAAPGPTPTPTPTPSPTPAPTPSPSPIRPKPPAGQGDKKPANMLEAMDAALSSMP